LSSVRVPLGWAFADLIEAIVEANGIQKERSKQCLTEIKEDRTDWDLLPAAAQDPAPK
jgi:hypothetical protein